jgi:hypothetical protein
MLYLPKSIPSDTFPLATDNKTAPLPFSQAFKSNITIDCQFLIVTLSENLPVIYESPEGSFEIRDSISEIRDSKFNILINQWE